MMGPAVKTTNPKIHGERNPKTPIYPGEPLLADLS
jgi:hypothetical protein